MSTVLLLRLDEQHIVRVATKIVTKVPVTPIDARSNRVFQRKPCFHHRSSAGVPLRRITGTCNQLFDRFQTDAVQMPFAAKLQQQDSHPD